MDSTMTKQESAILSGSARRSSRQDGFTLIEVLIASAIMTIGLLAVLGMFTTALSATQSSQLDQLAHARATQALESVYTARQTAQLGWDSINNTGTLTGIFTSGMTTLTDPGPDGLDGTADDVATAPIILPGPDGILGGSHAADDQTISLANFKRQIAITQAIDPTTGAQIPTLKQVVVTIQYPSSTGIVRSYQVQALVSQYR